MNLLGLLVILGKEGGDFLEVQLAGGKDLDGGRGSTRGGAL